MSASYSLLPLERNTKQSLNEYMPQFDLGVVIDITSRYPTPSEIRQVLDQMPEYTKDYFITEKVWDVKVYETTFYEQQLRIINGKCATIYSIEPTFDEFLPLSIYFHGGSEELNVEITLRLTRFTGPLLLIGDFDGIPLLVSPNNNVADLLSQWEKLRAIAHLAQDSDDRIDTTQSL